MDIKGIKRVVTKAPSSGPSIKAYCSWETRRLVGVIAAAKKMKHSEYILAAVERQIEEDKVALNIM